MKLDDGILFPLLKPEITRNCRIMFIDFSVSLLTNHSTEFCKQRGPVNATLAFLPLQKIAHNHNLTWRTYDYIF